MDSRQVYENLTKISSYILTNYSDENRKQKVSSFKYFLHINGSSEDTCDSGNEIDTIVFVVVSMTNEADMSRLSEMNLCKPRQFSSICVRM